MNPSNSIKLLAAIAMLASLAVTIYPLNNSAYGQNREYESAHEYNSNNWYSNDNGYYKDENKYKKDFFVFPPTERIAELGDKWWQWAFSLNNTTDINPFTNLGQPGCDIGLQEDLNVLFLVGSSGSPTHQCIIPSDIKILFPLVNVVCNSLEAPPFFGQTKQAQRKCSNNFIDTAFNLTLKIDGKTISNLEQYRLDSPPGGFEFEAVQGNLFLTPPGEGTGVSDGYWILLKLSPGQHQISFQGSLNTTELVRQPFIFTAGATYNLDVQPAEKSYYPNDYQQNYPIY